MIKKKTAIFIFILIIILPTQKSYSKNFFKQLEKEAKRVLRDNTEEVPNNQNNVDTAVYLNSNYDTASNGSQQTETKSGGLLKIGEKLGLNEKTVNILDAGFGLIKSRQDITPEEEIEIGSSLIIEIIERNGGRFENPQIQKYVNLVGNTISRYCDAGEMDFKFMVLNSDEINAFASPGGFVFITKGLYSIIENEAQLASVLAHEIAHVTNKHMIKTLQRAKMFMNLTKLTALASKKDVDKYSKVMGEVNSTLFEKGIDQEYEYEADNNALIYSSNANYNPFEFLVFLNNLEKLIGSRKSIFFSTHPDISLRIRRVNDELSSKYQNTGSVLSERFSSYKIAFENPNLKKKKVKITKNKK